MGYGREMAEDAEMQNFLFGNSEPYTEHMGYSKYRSRETQKDKAAIKALNKERDTKCERIMAYCLRCAEKESPNKKFPGCPNFELNDAWTRCENFVKKCYAKDEHKSVLSSSSSSSGYKERKG